ncbi:elongation factor G [Alsobacter sp. SYSU M60028]|uniref:Elongation factor G n=1 Tax=Alsobacter ponti TaxID=2962936 RepID=A0ABT1L6X2_9HYPH|nr:elongation factor G [Alsobacter ponti]MCP8937059.1 elongation factor G [Alsobacter ponti]
MGPRCIAIVGPFQSGKTTLLEAILERTGAVQRAGRVTDGSTVGDSSAEARAHGHGVEPNVATTTFMGERMTFIDCPGSVEFMHDMRAVTPVCDAAIVVCEADERKLAALQVVLRELEEAGIPRFVFLNKVETLTGMVHDHLAMLQTASRTPLLLRQMPIWKNGIIVGYIDLALERAFVYREHAPSEVVDISAEDLVLEREARFSMLERLADYDERLMEELIEEIEPPRDQVFDDLRKELRDGHAVPVLFGSADRANGITRLLKALRHEAPGVGATRDRLGVPASGQPLAHVMKTIHTAHGGKLSVARVLRGSFKEGDTVIGSGGVETRVGGVQRLVGQAGVREPEAKEGDVLAFGRLEGVSTGDSFAAGRTPPAAVASVAPPEPVFATAISTRDRKDDVRLNAALAKLTEEDPGLIMRHMADSGELRLMGQGEVHLRVSLERLSGRYGVEVDRHPPRIGYRETIRGKVTVRGRHKKQTGGHGQFGDVVLEVEPLPRGSGFEFVDKITGGVVPRQYISSVEHGVREALDEGTLGFPVVDVRVALTDGSYHTVDSSDMAFRAAARLGMAEALPKAQSVLLEPIHLVEIGIPSDAMSKASAIVSGRRGQILGYDARPGWEGWDTLKALMPESEIGDLIVELRSATSGVGTFSSSLDHLAELSGKPAEAVMRKAHPARHAS